MKEKALEMKPPQHLHHKLLIREKRSERADNPGENDFPGYLLLRSGLAATKYPRKMISGDILPLQ